ncbi:mannonate dehydratase [Rhodobacter maris]|uniref:Mannonate dehydratase n=1 Tax=Rhodobacter maris TaxID=446682 RepID=A0A285S5N7_9RHOB|nr:mannonate dehydratase [Rhodobacter maris]SOC02645.1 D-mannonate dehydratase [Rhodobacter maris]
MEECWRWYGPEFDRITLPEIAQTGATGIVHALHEIPYGEIWTREAIAARKAQIERAGFRWSVVESLPIHERIKRDDGDLSGLFANYRQSMANLAAEGVTTICYNFMPVLDWTRTDLQAPVARGGSCLRFEAYRMAAFEIHMLGREGAEDDYSPEVCARAKTWFEASGEAERNALLHAIMSGLPGAFDRYDIAGLKAQLALYDGIGREEIRRNYKRFLEEVIPAAEELGMRLCVHPDDPPRNILGLPRVVSNAEDIAWILQAVESLANGLTLCTGSLGANPVNDLPAIAERFAPRIHFAHLRNVKKDPDGSFEEAAHLAGDTDMIAVVKVLIAEEARRKAEGRADAAIPMRPDHGHELLADVGRGTFPGYPLIGRMRGLAELRGVVMAVSHG